MRRTKEDKSLSCIWSYFLTGLLWTSEAVCVDGMSLLHRELFGVLVSLVCNVEVLACYVNVAECEGEDGNMWLH